MLFAAEPDVQNPIAMAFDARGRLWVAENYTYAERAKKFDLQLQDRIVIFGDADGDGRADSRKVFADDLQMLTSITVGLGGVWALCPPQLLFIPDKNGDDVPDGPPEVVLDGFTVAQENYHNFANGLKWGPDGWLYGRCGASSPGELGLPGTPAAERVQLRGGIWRFHPHRKIVEVLTYGTTNPWGHDWDAHGEAFFINTVNGHLWHMIPGAHLVRPHTRDPNPRAYSMIDQHADHWHFDTGKDWTQSRDGKADAYGGGHAHSGMMIYQGDNWPQEYRGKLFTINHHGRRINVERLEHNAAGAVGKHEPDMVFFGDPWFRGIDLDNGPDGGVFVLDWSDTGECHDSNGVHRTSGRIFKITYGDPKKSKPVALDKLTPMELVNLLTAKNVWHARHAQLRLQEIAASNERMQKIHTALETMFRREKDVTIKLRVMWALHATGGASEAWLRDQLRHPNELIRTWAIRLLTDDWPIDRVTATAFAPVSAERSAPLLPDFVRLAKEDPSDRVRLTLASTLQRLPVADRAELAAPLLARKEDADHHDLPLLVWYGLIPVADANPAALTRLGGGCEWKVTRQYIARRLAEDIEKNPSPLNALIEIAANRTESFQTDVISGLGEALVGWRKAPKPPAWDSLAAKLAGTALDDRVRELSVVFGDGRALDEIKRVALDGKADIAARKAALQALIDARAPDLTVICEKLLGVRFLNPVAARGLALEDNPALGSKLVNAHRAFHPEERPQLLAVLVSRPVWAKALLDAVADGKVLRTEVSAFHARQIRNFNDAVLNVQLARVWGEIRESPEEKRQLIAKLKTNLTPTVLAGANKSQGRAFFNQICASCHTLYGQGRTLGPDLTGAGRDNLDYLLDNIVDPSAVVTADFRLSHVTLNDGRDLSGVIVARTDRTLTLKTQTETLTFEHSAIANTRASTLSMMPEGLLDAISPEQTRDLIAYLMSRQQVPLAEIKP